MHLVRGLLQMLAAFPSTFLLGSNSPVLAAALEPVLLACGARLSVETTSERALLVMNGREPPSLVLLDLGLPGMGISQLLACVRTEKRVRRFPIVLISDNVSAECMERLAEGVIDDLIPRTAPSSYWRLRIDSVMRAFRRTREMEQLREAAALPSQTDPVTGLYSQPALVSMLFRETDRVQRMKTALCLILFEIQSSTQWHPRLGTIAHDDLRLEMVGRIQRLLRSYDLFGRTGNEEFVLGLPGCSLVNAVVLAERIRLEVFSAPFSWAGQPIRVSACFGIAASLGRSPVVVLREAAKALQIAKAAGPDSIQCAGDSPMAEPAPFFSLASEDNLLAR
jgi:two-component system, cell cycle response regulator